MSKSFYDAHVESLELVRVTHCVYCLLAACPAKPRMAIEAWAKLHFLLLPPNRDDLLLSNREVCRADPAAISPVESIAMTARGNTEYMWGERTFTCAHAAAWMLAREIDDAVSISTSLNPRVGMVIRESDPQYPNSGLDAWKAAFLQDAQSSGLLDAHGEPTDRWPRFVELFQQRSAGLIWAGSEQKLKTALRLEYNAARHLAKEDKGPAMPQKNREGDVAPTNYLKNWREILTTLERKNTAEEHRFVAKLNQEYDGPIIPAKQGGRPMVVKSKLLEWWNRLEILFETQGGGNNTRANVEEQYAYGRNETVVPEIKGHVKKKRGKHT